MRYYERAVVIAYTYIGNKPRLVIAMMRIMPGETEKDVVVKVKQKELDIVKDMAGLMAKRPPDVTLYGVTPKDEPIPDGHGVSSDIELWDEEGLTSWEQVCVSYCPAREKGRRVPLDESHMLVVG